MEKDKIQHRSISIDALKGFAALLVCYQHAYGTYGISGYILAISRIAVPLFVMITGFYYCSIVDKHKEKVQIKKFAFIAIVMVLLYFSIDSAKRIFTGNLIGYWKSCFTPLNILKFVVLNDPVHANHSWYMWAMIYVLVLVWLFPRIWKQKCIRRSIIILTCFGLPFLSKYIYFFCTSINFEPNLYRNFLIPIAAYFFLGIECLEKKDKITRFGMKKWGILAILSVACICMEKYILTILKIDRLSGAYFFSMPLAVAVFGMTLSGSFKSKGMNILAKFGRKYSLAFYIIHPLFSRVEYKIFNMETVQQYAGYVFVVLCSAMLSVLYENIKEKRGI